MLLSKELTLKVDKTEICTYVKSTLPLQRF